LLLATSLLCDHASQVLEEPRQIFGAQHIALPAEPHLLDLAFYVGGDDEITVEGVAAVEIFDSVGGDSKRNYHLAKGLACFQELKSTRRHLTVLGGRLGCLARFERFHFLRVEHEPSTTAHRVKGLAFETPNRALVHTEAFGDFVAGELRAIGLLGRATTARHVS